MMRSPSAFIVARSAALLCVVACSSSGTGRGELVRPPNASTSGGENVEVARDLPSCPNSRCGPVVFAWHSDGASVIRGRVHATLPSGQTFDGTFMQVTSQSVENDYMPFWTGWDIGWPSWPTPWGRYWYGPGTWYGPRYAPVSRFITHYSGRVIANLKAKDDTRMRCRFLLQTPSSGLSGGGAGDCELSTGMRIEDITFPSG